MAMPNLLSVFLFQLVLVLVLLDDAHGQGLSPNFYQKTCPKLETIVRQTTARFISGAPPLAATILRMQFHDCMVRGCDGSLLINSTKKNSAEKDAIPNSTLRGFGVIDAVKSAVEKSCPGVVSCADILTLVTRDAVSMVNGPSWVVELGRRDGRISKASEALNDIPAPFFNLEQLKASFKSIGLSVKDLAVLSGAHTIGIGHCFTFTNRLYNFTGKGDTDPSMDKNYIPKLKSRCKPADQTTFVEMDPGSSRTFDTSYYKMVSKRRGLFQSDAALLNDRQTKAYVQQQAKSFGNDFFNDFAASMIKLGRVGVLTGKAGEIRKHCAFVN